MASESTETFASTSQSNLSAPTANNVLRPIQQNVQQSVVDLSRRFPTPSVPILRSSQLDAGRLDDEIQTLLHEQLAAVTAYMHPAARLKMQPEFSALVSLLLVGLSIWRNDATPGSNMMNLKYRDERPFTAAQGSTASSFNAPGGRTGVEGIPPCAHQRCGLVLGWVLLPWAWQRTLSAIARAGWHTQPEGSWQLWAAWLALKAESAVKIAGFVNFLAFLRTGKYRSLLERLLRIRLVYARPVMARAMSFDYLNRQLVWAQVSELFLFMLPLLDNPRLKGLLSLPKGLWLTHTQQVDADADAMQAGCQICGRSEASNPFAAQPCKHTFCYYCIRSRTESDPQYVCPCCQSRVLAIVAA